MCQLFLKFLVEQVLFQSIKLSCHSVAIYTIVNLNNLLLVKSVIILQHNLEEQKNDKEYLITAAL